MRSSTLLTLLVAAVTAKPTANAPPPGAVIVKPGDNLQSIVNANAGKTIFLQAGKYKGPIVIKSKITMMGATDNEESYSGNKATITIYRAQEEGFNNHQTAAVQVEADGVKFYHVNFENTWGLKPSKDPKNPIKNQALAVSTQGDEIGFYGCKLDGWQDTLETEGKGARSLGKQVFAKCLVQGCTDFIFGKTAAAWFEDCDIKVKDKDVGYVTAQGRENKNGGGHYVFNKCEVSGSAKGGSYFLGRPWRPFAAVMFQNSKLSGVINQAGWSKWKPDNVTEPVGDLEFREYQNTGAGSDIKGRKLGKRASGPDSISKTLGGDYNSWVDMKYMK
ncbi:pectin lyase-like protein [Tothia fuscella]|uniref:pectinesterase n=1 Tax=Tothia fuscella TaxID=1048955 RepID=A0A9P4NRR1_9PEZI|nr:pectin lyase-like protein [Tothia fuscella]